MILLLLVGLLWVLPVIVATGVTTRTRGSATPGLMLGLFLGWIGVVIAYCLVPTVPSTPPAPTRPCPHCAEPIQLAAVVCRFCGRDVPPVEVDTRPNWFGRPIIGTVCKKGHPGPVGARRCETCGSRNMGLRFDDSPTSSTP